MNQTNNTQTSIFGDIKIAPDDPILGLNVAFKNDKSPSKVNLGVGAYRTSEGQPYLLECVKQAEKILFEKQENKEYQPQEGNDLYRKLVPKLFLGKKHAHLVDEGKVATSQSLSGTGALRLGFAFVKSFLKKDIHIYVPTPTWGNHFTILEHCGFDKNQVKTYDYYDQQTRGLNLKSILNTFEKAEEGSLILLHLCAHNPTGVDPNKEEWQKIANVCKKRKFVVYFDNAYQGFATGDLDEDSYALQLFISMGMEVICAQSFAKNFGLYGERIGSINFVCNSSKTAHAIVTQLQIIVRAMYSNPPLHASRLITTILSDKKLYGLWLEDLKVMSSRIFKMRKLLFDKLHELKTPGNWDHILNQIGMFTFTGLTKTQVDVMVNKYHIYMLGNGRISMSGLNEKNVDYVGKAIYDCVVNYK